MFSPDKGLACFLLKMVHLLSLHQEKSTMKLLTQEIIKALPTIYSTDSVPLHEKIVICKFFTPDSAWTWFVFEGQPDGDDFLFFGMVHGHVEEMGYFCLSELLEVRGHLGLPIERDASVFKVPYGKLIGV